MDKPRILSGELLVHNGALKVNCTLPELGLKDVTPNGSWLEQKQIQAALEARMHLIEVERIEKSGVLSHAEWREDLKLAEVTQKVGGYWQYLGHNVGKQLFLNPEEALFLMEVNCLLLKYDGVKVSLQQAYALVLQSGVTMTQYKVYASLSRLGYRVYRHTSLKTSSSTESPKEDVHVSDIHNEDAPVDVNKNSDNGIISADNEVYFKTKDLLDNEECNLTNDIENKQSEIEEPSSSRSSKKANIIKSKIAKYVQYKIRKLKSRKFKSSNNVIIMDIPDFTKDSKVTINTPPCEYLPVAIASTSHLYRLNVENIKSRFTNEVKTTPTTNIPDRSINMEQLRARFPSPNFNINHYFHNTFNFRFRQHSNPFNVFNFWRFEANYNYYQGNMNLPFGQNTPINSLNQPFFLPRFANAMNFNLPNANIRKRSMVQSKKKERLETIKHFASLVKKSIISSAESTPYITKLKELIKSFNEQYKSRIRVTDDFSINYEENDTFETVELDDDDQQTAKKPKSNTNPFNDKLKKLEQMAYQLKLLQTNNEATSQHKRMFNKLIKRFNDAYNVNYYVDDDYYIINRNDLTVDLSSSDAETIPETDIVPTTSKKLKNPFSIIKQLSEKQKKTQPKIIQKELSAPMDIDNNSNQVLEKAFVPSWLPSESDFGRPEIISNKLAKTVLDINKEDLIFDFMKMQPDKFNNWVEAKISLLECLQKTSEIFADIETEDSMTSNYLLTPKDYSSFASVIKALSIIKSHKEISEDSNLVVHFDVYKRDTQNFKKSNRPLPLFRVVCLRESSTFPSGADIASLHSKYKDGVTILFALIENSSISYLQVNPIDLPVYLPRSENTV